MGQSGKMSGCFNCFVMRIKKKSQFPRSRQRFPEMDLMPFILIGITLILLLAASARFLYKVFSPITDLPGKKECYLYIPTGARFTTILDSLSIKKCLISKDNFISLAKRKQYDSHIIPGRYRIKDKMSANSLVNLLRSGRQEPLRITIHNVRTSGELAGKLGKKFETDSSQFIRLFNDPDFLARFGVSPATLFVIFIPNTYDFYWNTSCEALLVRMKKEYQRFWSAQRRQLVDSLNMTILQVVILASIVEKESNKDDEKPAIAGVYLNRLKKKMLLQADPTVIFATQDFTIKRVLKKHTELKSPYNTYLYAGIPPGPICLPSIASIEAVLMAKTTNYLYFCAKDDFSGYHNFAATLDEHNRNARRYQAALNKLNIR